MSGVTWRAGWCKELGYNCIVGSYVIKGLKISRIEQALLEINSLTDLFTYSVNYSERHNKVYLYVIRKLENK